MKWFTVKELYKACKEQISKWNGNKVVYITDDDEGNGYHCIRYDFQDDYDEIVETANVVEFHWDDDLENVVLLW